VKVVCHILLESSQRRVQLFFKPQFNRRFTHKVMGPQICESLNLGNFKTPMAMVSPKSKLWWILWVYFCPWLIHAPKMLQLCTNQLVVLFMQVYVNNWPTCHLSYSHPRAPAHPSTLEMLWAKEHTQLFIWCVSKFLDRLKCEFKVKAAKE